MGMSEAGYPQVGYRADVQVGMPAFLQNEAGIPTK